MPCYDGPRPEDQERDRLMVGAMPALLCGVLKQDALAKLYADAWCTHHTRVDEENAAGRRYSERSTKAQQLCDNLLIEFNLRRGAVERCKHPNMNTWSNIVGYCPNCGARVAT